LIFMKNGGGDAQRVFHLWALGPSLTLSISLPPAGTVTLGRSLDADVRLDDPSVSRLHARLHVSSSGVSIEDLGSANGTRVGSRTLRRAEVGAFDTGQAANLGSVTLVLSAGKNSKAPSPVVTSDEFVARLLLAAQSAGRGEPGSTLAHVYVSGPLPAREIEQSLAEAGHPKAPVTLTGAGGYALLLEGIGAAEAHTRLEHTAARLRAQGVTISFELEHVDTETSDEEARRRLAAARSLADDEPAVSPAPPQHDPFNRTVDLDDPPDPHPPVSPAPAFLNALCGPHGPQRARAMLALKTFIDAKSSSDSDDDRAHVLDAHTHCADNGAQNDEPAG
jgi:FHA domain-containing protein